MTCAEFEKREKASPKPKNNSGIAKNRQFALMRFFSRANQKTATIQDNAPIPKTLNADHARQFESKSNSGSSGQKSVEAANASQTIARGLRLRIETHTAKRKTPKAAHGMTADDAPGRSSGIDHSAWDIAR